MILLRVQVSPFGDTGHSESAESYVAASFQTAFISIFLANEGELDCYKLICF